MYGRLYFVPYEKIYRKTYPVNFLYATGFASLARNRGSEAHATGEVAVRVKVLEQIEKKVAVRVKMLEKKIKHKSSVSTSFDRPFRPHLIVSFDLI